MPSVAPTICSRVITKREDTWHEYLHVLGGGAFRSLARRDIIQARGGYLDTGLQSNKCDPLIDRTTKEANFRTGLT